MVGDKNKLSQINRLRVVLRGRSCIFYLCNLYERDDVEHRCCMGRVYNLVKVDKLLLEQVLGSKLGEFRFIFFENKRNRNKDDIKM